VLAVDIAGSKLAEVYKGNSSVVTIALDVADSDASQRLVAEARKVFGGLDILVNNAGIGGDFVRIDQSTDENWRRLMAVNVDAVFRVTREFVPMLKASKYPRVISTGSVSSLFAIAYIGAYTVTKHAVLGMMRAFAVDLGEYGITCNCILPGNTVTGITREFFPDSNTPEGKDYLAMTNVLGRYSYPRDLAGAALYLASDFGSYITGQSIAVDGGMMARVHALPKSVGEPR
jgi:3-oxoacyl-[acyl-carrier protein] reductase